MAEKCLCIQCNRATNHNIIKEHKTAFHDEEGWWEESLYQILQCAGCETISYRTRYTDPTQYSYEYDCNMYSDSIFPRRDANTRDIKATKNLPQNLTTIYRETIDSFNNGQYILCSAGLRALIEGICIDKKIIGKEITTKKGITKMSTSLESKIDGLSINRFLTEENSSALHELRFLGNEALHELSPPDVGELIIAIDIIELTLTNVYELSHKTSRLRSAVKVRKEE